MNVQILVKTQDCGINHHAIKRWQLSTIILETRV